MTTLHQLTRQGRRLVGSWLPGAVELELAAEHVRAVTEVPWLDPAHIEPLMAEVRGHEPDDAAIDRLAVELHRRLPMGRRLANDADVWAWIGVGPLRQMLERRWSRSAEKERRDRYLGPPRRHGLGRLWWAAELTASSGEDLYVETRRLVGVQSQYLLDRLLASRLSRTTTVVHGLLDVLAGKTDFELISGTMKQVGALSSTVCLEALDREEVADLVRGLARDVSLRLATRQTID